MSNDSLYLVARLFIWWWAFSRLIIIIFTYFIDEWSLSEEGRSILLIGSLVAGAIISGVWCYYTGDYFRTKKDGQVDKVEGRESSLP
jgi:hypothetical protein